MLAQIMAESEEIKKLAAITSGLQSRIESGVIRKVQRRSSYLEDDFSYFDGKDGVRLAAVAIERSGRIEEVVITVVDTGSGGFKDELKRIQHGLFVPTVIVDMSSRDARDQGRAAVDYSVIGGSGSGIAVTSTRTNTYVSPDYTLKLLEYIPQE